MTEIKQVPPFYEKDISAIEGPLPFTNNFNLDNPKMIDLSLLGNEETEKLLRELERRQNHGDVNTSWTSDHVKLLFELRTRLNKNQNAIDYVPLKDRPRR